jgi:hypothetical protein
VADEMVFIFKGVKRPGGKPDVTIDPASQVTVRIQLQASMTVSPGVGQPLDALLLLFYAVPNSLVSLQTQKST